MVRTAFTDAIGHRLPAWLNHCGRLYKRISGASLINALKWIEHSSGSRKRMISFNGCWPLHDFVQSLPSPLEHFELDVSLAVKSPSRLRQDASGFIGMNFSFLFKLFYWSLFVLHCTWCHRSLLMFSGIVSYTVRCSLMLPTLRFFRIQCDALCFSGSSRPVVPVREASNVARQAVVKCSSWLRYFVYSANEILRRHDGRPPGISGGLNHRRGLVVQSMPCRLHPIGMRRAQSSRRFMRVNQSRELRADLVD